MTDTPRRTYVDANGAIVRRWSPQAAAMVPMAEYRQMVDQRDKAVREARHAQLEAQVNARIVKVVRRVLDDRTACDENDPPCAVCRVSHGELLDDLYAALEGELLE